MWGKAEAVGAGRRRGRGYLLVIEDDVELADAAEVLVEPDDMNRAQNQIASTNQHPMRMVRK